MSDLIVEGVFTWSQSAPWSMVSEQALPRAPKSADSMDGAMIAGGHMARGSATDAGNGLLQLLAPMAEGLLQVVGRKVDLP